jgi:hypothetical protein
VIVGKRTAQDVPCVTVYEASNWQGKSHRGCRPAATIVAQLGLANDTLSSLRVPRGLRAVLHEHAGFAGAKIAYEADTSNVGSFDDKTSSIVVEVVGARHEIVIPPVAQADEAAGRAAAASWSRPTTRGCWTSRRSGPCRSSCSRGRSALPVELEGDVAVSVRDHGGDVHREGHADRAVQPRRRRQGARHEDRRPGPSSWRGSRWRRRWPTC